MITLPVFKKEVAIEDNRSRLQGLLTKKKTSGVGFFFVLKQQFQAERTNTKKYGVTIMSNKHQTHLTVTLEHMVFHDDVIKVLSTSGSDRHVNVLQLLLTLAK